VTFVDLLLVESLTVASTIVLCFLVILICISSIIWNACLSLCLSLHCVNVAKSIITAIRNFTYVEDSVFGSYKMSWFLLQNSNIYFTTRLINITSTAAILDSCLTLNDKMLLQHRRVVRLNVIHSYLELF
jgi:hypothetical protein